MYRTRTIVSFAFVIGFILSTAAFAPAGGGDSVENYVKIKNNWDVAMRVYFKCYTNNSWEQNDCPNDNTPETIEPGDSHKWKYDYEPGMGCQSIHVGYTRYDRDCETCKKDFNHTFAEDEAKIMKIVSHGTGPTGYIMEPVHGTFVD